MAAETDLATLADVRSWLGFKAATVEHDADLERLISACSTTMQRLIGRTIVSTAYNQFQDGTGSGIMVVRNSPIVRFSAIVVEDRALDPKDYSYDESTIYLAGRARFPRGRHNVQLRYIAGYDEVPADLAQACVETVGMRWRERDRIGMTSKGLAGETTSFSLADFSPSVRTVLESYKRVAPV